ncbi:MAG: thioredoxin domain-containing protein [Planctomycetes bacterium]|nr:thioredoxin domain-containing protein [Planctomycetota bacterium]
MKRTWPVLAPAIFLSLVGALISYYLLFKHFGGDSGAVLEWVCEGGEDSKRSCDQVLGSEYGMFPAVDSALPPTEKYVPRPIVGGITMVPRPVALFGLMYFSALAVWYIAVGRPSRSRRIDHLLPLLFNICGVIGAIYYVKLMFTVMEAWCPWCVVTHVINALLLVCAILLWPGRRTAVTVAQTAKSDAPAGTPLPAGEAPHPVGADSAVNPACRPGTRLLIVTLGCIVAVCTAQWFMVNTGQANEIAAYNIAQVQAFNKEASKLMYGLYQSAKKHQIPRRPGDAVRNDGKQRLTLVIFSDLQCPHCATFAELIDKRIVPLFEGKLRIVFKHFPANKECNEHIARDLHPRACEAARAAEAARMLGGSDTFWKAHDLLFALRKAKDGPDFRALATQLELDPDRFVEAMKSEETATRIAEDIALAIELGANATPAAYVAGRRVPRVAVKQMLFWQAVKKRLDQVLEARRKKQEKEAKAKEAKNTATAPAQGN